MTKNTYKINQLETQVKNLQKSLTEANRKNTEKTPKEVHKSKRQTALQTVSESGRMTDDDIDFLDENSSNLNWEVDVYNYFQDFNKTTYIKQGTLRKYKERNKKGGHFQ